MLINTLNPEWRDLAEDFYPWSREY
jgi:hypothetical protein